MASSVHILLIVALCSSLTMSRPPVPTSTFPMVWCYWAGHTAVAGGGATCQHGAMMGPCGVTCLKGAGEICGGIENSYGVCGPGFQCLQNKCH